MCVYIYIYIHLHTCVHVVITVIDIITIDIIKYGNAVAYVVIVIS